MSKPVRQTVRTAGNKRYKPKRQRITRELIARIEHDMRVKLTPWQKQLLREVIAEQQTSTVDQAYKELGKRNE